MIYVIDKVKVRAVTAPSGKTYFLTIIDAWDKESGQEKGFLNPMCFGDMNATTAFALRWAAGCYSGEIENPNGHCTSTACLSLFRKAMANATLLEEFREPVQVSATDLVPIPAVDAILAAHGLPAIRDAVKYPLFPHLHAEVMAAFCMNAGLPIGKLFTGNVANYINGTNPYPVTVHKTGTDIVLPDVYENDGLYWVSGVMANGTNAGDCVAKMIRKYAMESEIRIPGSAESVIKAIIAAVEDPLPLHGMSLPSSSTPLPAPIAMDW